MSISITNIKIQLKQNSYAVFFFFQFHCPLFVLYRYIILHFVEFLPVSRKVKEVSGFSSCCIFSGSIAKVIPSAEILDSYKRTGTHCSLP